MNRGTNIQISKNIITNENIIAILNFNFNNTTGEVSFDLRSIMEDEIEKNTQLIQENIEEFKKVINENSKFNNYPFKLF